MPERAAPTQQELESYVKDRNNWGRWGADDELGAMNLITTEKRIAAARLVRTGRSLSLSRFIPKTPGPGNPTPAQHFMRSHKIGTGGAATDFYGISFHGMSTTHLDALCHVWGSEGLYNGRDPDKEITFDGANFGSVDKWADGIVTRGVLVDVPKFRGEPYVTMKKPVHGWELEDILRAQGVTLEPGDALAVFCGRGAWENANPDTPYAEGPKPGIHASCLPVIHDNDICLIAWDMQECSPSGYDLPFPLDLIPVHAIIPAFGAAVLDNVQLEELADALRAEGRSEFMLVVSPLKMKGGTGSPVNPIALF